MLVASNQPYLFPYIGYWQLMNLADTFVISDSMQYIKKGYINRNYILLNGERHRFTMEVMGVHGTSLINEASVGNNARKIISTIKHAYKNAPYFNEVFPLIDDLLHHKEKNLARYLGHSMQAIAQYIGMNTDFIYLSELQGETDLKAQDRTIDICKRVNAEKYVNAIGGQSLYDKESFKNEGMELSFLEVADLEYKQYRNDFVPHLSIIDVLMFNSKDEVNDLLGKYALI